MRKAIIASLGVLALSAGVAGVAMAGAGAGTGIVGSKHDMRNYAGMHGGIVDPEGRVCAYCHTPHHAVDDPNGDYEPLWSRGFTELTNFASYESATLNAEYNADIMVGPSRLCMSCHDGAVAIDNYYGNAGNADLIEGDGFGEIGVGRHGNMSNDHPIGFQWSPVAQADPEIIGSGETDLFPWGTSVTLDKILWGSEKIFTCASCHDVHNSADVQDAYFIYGKQQDSAFCTGCHLK